MKMIKRKMIIKKEDYTVIWKIQMKILKLKIRNLKKKETMLLQFNKLIQIYQKEKEIKLSKLNIGNHLIIQVSN